MTATEALLGLLAALIVVLLVTAVALAAALMGRGPLYGRFLTIDRRPPAPVETPHPGPAANRQQSSVGFLTRERRAPMRPEGSPTRAMGLWDDELDEVLRGSYAAATFHKSVRILAWSFILVVLLIVSVSGLWQSQQPAIYTTLILAGIFVLVGHELLPPSQPGTARIVVEASAGIIFLLLLVSFTGNEMSPFFFLFPLLIGGVALITSPSIAVFLTFETCMAYAITALSGPLNGTAASDALTRLVVNVAALLLLSYSGVVISRVQRRTREAAVRLSTLDSLTELYSRAYLFNAVDREIQRSRRYRRGFCLLMMDLDGLKSINDRLGHFQGDAVLRSVAQLIREGLRGIDVAARYGGDEFVAVLPETDPSGAYVVAEKIRQSVSDLIVDASNPQIRTSLSIGVVSYPEDGQTADELMIAADEAMYSSKRLGKNRVVGYAEPGETPVPGEVVSWPHASTPGFRPLGRDPNRPNEPGEER